MENDSNADDFIEVTEEEPPDIAICPYCKSSLGEYEGEAYDDDEYLGSQYRCTECGETFFDIWKYGDNLD